MLIDIRAPSDYSAMVAQQATNTVAQEMDPARERPAGMAYHAIILATQDGIACIARDRPEALNACREPMRAAIGAAIHEVRDDPASEVLICTRTGRAFAGKRAPQFTGHAC